MAGKRPDYQEKFERQRQGGGGYADGPGREGMPTASDMDRPSDSCGTYDRHGDGTMSIPRGIRTNQDQNGNGGRR